MTTRPQTWQIVNQEPLSVLETQTREPLHNLNKILDSKLDYPFRIELAGSTLNINPSEIQTIKSDGNGGFQDSFRIAPSPILGKYKNIELATLDFTTGVATGSFDSSSLASAPSLDANFYVYLGIELHTNGKYYLVWGKESDSLDEASKSNNLPIFTTGDSVCLIKLKNNGFSGKWNFIDPLPTDIVIFKESNQLEIREDVTHKIRAVDLVSEELPQSLNPVIDGVSIAENDLVLFTRGEIEGVYRFVPSEDYYWEKVLAPKNGTNVQVIDGTTYFRTIWKKVQSIWRPVEVADAVKEPSGFPNRIDSTFSFDEESRTFTIEPAVLGGHFDYFQKGVVRRKNGPSLLQIDNLEGIHYIYFDGDELKSNYAEFDEYILREAAYVATVSWDATNSKVLLLGDERHGITMDGATHKYLHLSVGTVLQSGLGITAGDFKNTDGSLDSDAQFSLADGRLFDEDIDFKIKHSDNPSAFFEQELYPIAKIPIFYKSGIDTPGDEVYNWRKLEATEFAFHTEFLSGVRSMQYNTDIGGASGWVFANVADIGSVGYASTWVFATNSVIEPVIGVMGQNSYTSLSEAQENEQYTFLNVAGLPVIEFKLLFRIIWEVSSDFANTPNTRIADVQDLRVSPDSPFPSVSPNDHGLLSGLGDPDHPPRAVTTSGVVKDGGLSNSDADMADVLDTLNKLLGQLRLKEHPTNKKRVILTGSKRVINSGLSLGQELNNLLISFEGAEIDFVSGNIFDSNGITPLGLSFTPVIVPDGDYHWYSINLVGSGVNVDSTLGADVLVIPNSNTNSNRDLAPKAPFANGIKIGQVLVRGSLVSGINDILQSDIIQLGTGSGSGSGSGDANELLERLKDRLNSSIFEYMTPNIFSSTGQSLTDEALTDASFSVVDQAYVFDSLNQEYVSIDNLDDEFLNPVDENDLIDINEIELATYYAPSNTDELADVFVSRDRGLNWQKLNMSRIGSSDTFLGKHIFTEELTFQYTETFGGPKDTNFIFNGSSSISKSFEITIGTTVVNRIEVQAIIIGNPTGSLRAKIVRDDNGSPSVNPLDLISVLQPVRLSEASTGTLVFLTETPLLANKTYHVVFETDGQYANTYSSSLGNSRVTIDSRLATGAIVTVKGRPLSLLVAIVGKTLGAILKGYGIFYKKETTFENVSGLLTQEKFIFNGLTENLNEFTLNFLPDRKLLKIYEIGTAQVYRFGSFLIQGYKVIFPHNTFKKNEIITLVFEQSIGSSFDNSDTNGALLTSNHLGSLDGSFDASQPGRGILIRNGAGILRELWLDENDNINVTDPK
jgi:hypothetical protein